MLLSLMNVSWILDHHLKMIESHVSRAKRSLGKLIEVCVYVCGGDQVEFGPGSVNDRSFLIQPSLA